MDENVLIVDDHPIVLEGLILILESSIAVKSIFTALNASEALDCVNDNHDIDWIFLDVMLPDVNGIDLLQSLRQQKCTANIVLLSSEVDPAVIDNAFKQKASGFLSKSFKKPELELCLRSIEQGKIYLSKENQILLQNYRSSVLREKEDIEKRLSKRQLQTLQLISSGYSNQEIATSFGVAESTVKSHVHSLMQLFSADNRTHCVSEARRLNLIA